MSNRRIVQHRQQRDTNTRESAELKKENEKLKRQVARLRKQVEKLDVPVEESPVETPKDKPACPKCRSTNLGEISTPNGKTITSCRACKKWRSRAT